MGYKRVLVDTSIIIDYLRKKKKEESIFIELYKKYEVHLSVITVFELYNGATSELKLHEIETICNNVDIIDFDLLTAKLSSRIYRELIKKNKIIEFRDIFISATALNNGIPLATLNKKHFNRISGLRII